MISKLLFSKSLNDSCRILNKIRCTNQIYITTRNLNTIYRIENERIALSYASTFRNRSFLFNKDNFVRHQSSQSAETAVITDKVETIASNINNETLNDVASNQTASQWIQNSGEILTIPDAPTPIVEVAQILSANSEPTLASLGLCNFTPPGLIQYCLEWLHVYQNLPWWSTIVIGTVFLRVVLFPLIIKTQRNTRKFAEHMPKIQYLTQKLSEARRSGDMYEASIYATELMNFTKNSNFSPFKSFLMPLIQAPIFISVYYALTSMAQKVDSLKTGGFLWFHDLTVHDPYFALPIITSITFFITLEIGADAVSTKAMQPIMRIMIRVLPFLILPFTMYFPSAILVYWATNNVISLCQVSLLKIPKVQEYFNIPIVKIDPKYKQENIYAKKGFKRGFQDTIQNFRIARDMRERDNFNEVQFRQAGKGPLVKTYDYNPKERNREKVAAKQKK